MLVSSEPAGGRQVRIGMVTKGVVMSRIRALEVLFYLVLGVSLILPGQALADCVIEDPTTCSTEELAIIEDMGAAVLLVLDQDEATQDAIISVLQTARDRTARVLGRAGSIAGNAKGLDRNTIRKLRKVHRALARDLRDAVGTELTAALLSYDVFAPTRLAIAGGSPAKWLKRVLSLGLDALLGIGTEDPDPQLATDGGLIGGLIGYLIGAVMGQGQAGAAAGTVAGTLIGTVAESGGDGGGEPSE